MRNGLHCCKNIVTITILVNALPGNKKKKNGRKVTFFFLDSLLTTTGFFFSKNHNLHLFSTKITYFHLEVSLITGLVW